MIRHDGRVLDAGGIAVGRVVRDVSTWEATDDRHRVRSRHATKAEAEAAVLARVRCSDRDVAILRARIVVLLMKNAELGAELTTTQDPTRVREIVEAARRLMAELDAIASEVGMT